MTYEDTRREVSAYPQTADTVNVGSQAAYNPHQDFVNQVFAPPPGFHGLNLGIFNIGVTDSGSFTAGVNIPGIVRVQPRVGLDNGVGVGVGPRGILGPDVDVTALRLDQDGLHTGVRERTTVFGVVNHGLDAGADLGAATGARFRTGANVGPIEGRVGGHAYLDQNGLDSRAGGNVNAANVAGVYGGGHLALNNRNSELRGGAGAYLGDLGANAGAGVWSDQNTTVRPDVYASGQIHGQRGTLELNPQRHAEAVQVQPLYPAATPEAVNSYSNWARQDVVDHSVYQVQPGQRTYRDVAAALAPGANEQYLEQSERYLAYINHNKHLKAGDTIATLKAEHVDLRVRQMTAQHFGWQMPTA
ncbi:MAG TPA: hypothetical protein V6D22_21570 [Candidatus Obscuribacterales bacterium]